MPVHRFSNQYYRQTPLAGSLSVLPVLLLTACLGQPVTQEDADSGITDSATSEPAETLVSPFDVVAADTPGLLSTSITAPANLSSGTDYYDSSITGIIHSYQSKNYFHVASTLIDAGSTSRIDNGGLPDLADGKCIEATGHLDYRQSHRVLVATRIKFKPGYCY